MKDVLPRLLRARFIAVVALGALFTFGTLFCFVSRPRLLQTLEHNIYDALLSTRRGPPKTPVPIIVDLDEASLEAYGQWPWPRVLVADMIRRLQENGVAAVGLDILLSEPDRSSPLAVRERLEALTGNALSFGSVPAEFLDYDRYLAERLNETTVLGMRLQYGPASGVAEPALPKPVTVVLRKTPDAAPFDAHMPKATTATVALPVLLAAAPSGSLDITPEYDGVVRRMPLVSICRDKVYATLALRCLMAAMKRNNLVLSAGPDGLYSVRAGDFTVPVSPDGTALLPFRGGGRTFPYYSAKDILDGTVAPEKLAGRIAFVGTSAPGLLDMRVTPFDRGIAGVEIHATLLDAMLSSDFIHVPAWMPGAQALAICLTGFVSALAFGFARPRVYLPVGIVLTGAAVYASIHLFGQGVYFSPLYVTGLILLTGSVLLMLRFWQEETQKRVLRGAFSRYVAPEVVERITRLEGNIFEGEERELTIMFTDIRGFTTLSEKLAPQDIVQLLNRYFTPMTAIVRRNRGTLDKFIGDALMAFWNAPLNVPGHAALAVKSALAMHRELEGINRGLRADFGVELRMGAGLHTGKAYVGNMGSEELVNYTLIGDNVNLASRLEGLCGTFGVRIAASAETRDSALAATDQWGPEGPPVFQPLDTLRVKGKSQPVSVFAVLTSEEGRAREKELRDHSGAFAAYQAGDFAKAASGFADLAAAYPDVGMYRIFSERLERLNAAPPEDWDGVWTMTGK